MNVTLRVLTQQDSLIVKQARPWVAKYPSIAAPLERAHFEQRFYELVAAHPPIAQRMPALLGSSPADYLLVLEDLGHGADATNLYRRDTRLDTVHHELNGLIQWLAKLHTWSRSIAPTDQLENLELRTLNHSHIFEIPLADPPAIDLEAVTPGLSDLAAVVRQDHVQRRLAELGELYLVGSSGEIETRPRCLLHGDFFPGSWLRTEDELKVIDPEFCFFGRPEFDLGVLVAHLRLARADATAISALLRTYTLSANEVDVILVEEFAAAEVIRRLIGVAQLPLDHSLAEKKQLLEAALDVF